MKIPKKLLIKHIEILIRLSCEDLNQLNRFELFHKMLIRMSYNAADVTIYYDLKRLSMNVLSEYESFDLENVDEFAEPVRVNLPYNELDVFLQSGLCEKVANISRYYPFLLDAFFAIEDKEASF